MASELRFDGKVVIITGAGNGLGRSHARLFGSRGAQVVVNDLGGSAFGAGKSSAAADTVVEEIKGAGGSAVANYDSVEDGAKIVQCALDSFGRVDIVVNNAGILRDTTFHKMTQDDWDLIYRVHVLGAFRVTHAAWPHLRDQGYGRVVMTASAAGIYGNFGQANYAMAKLGLLGFANTLSLEGRKKNVLVNTIAPIAGSRLTETVMPKELTDALAPELVSPLVAWLCHESSTETGGLFEVGGGFFAKLRWERSAGHTFRLGRPVSIEAVAKAAPAFSSFEKATHPPDITSSMQPVMANLQAGKSKGGNAFIDVDLALGFEFPAATTSYDERDLAIYALGVGAAADPLDAKDLRLVYEMHGDGQLALPTYGVIPALNVMMTAAKEGRQAPGLSYGLDRLLHGEQYTELKRPLPTHAKLTHRVRIKDIFDKGKNAAIVMEVRTSDETGEELVRNEFTSIIRGAGGWGGDRGPTGDSNAPPDRAPDATVTEHIPESQALLYRLSGDWNPLHADPSFASAFGFPRPILHGLCTYGYAARHVVKAFANGDPRTFKSIKVRFADSVYPGETLLTEMWKESETRIVFRCKVKERDKVVISNAAIELYPEIPKPKKLAPQPAAAAAPASAAPTAPAAGDLPTSAEVFVAIRDHFDRHPDLGKLGTTFLFKLTDPASAWTLECKGDRAAVVEGSGAKPDATLELSDADFLSMTSGKADPQKLYFAGKLKISGNVMASQKLEFLKKMDPAAGMAAILKARGAAAPAVAKAPALVSAPAAAAKPPAPPAAKATEAPAAKATEAPALFAKLGERLAKRSAEPREAAVMRFKLTAPPSQWTVDLGSGAVSEGAGAAPTTTLTLAEEDLLALARGAATAAHLFQNGRLRVDGDLRAAAGLAILDGLA